MRTRYVIAADGNRSSTRERFGIGMHGHGLLSNSITVYFRAETDLGPSLRDRSQGVHYVTNPLLRGFFRLDRSGNRGFLVVNLVGDISRPEIVAAYSSAPSANVAGGSPSSVPLSCRTRPPCQLRHRAGPGRGTHGRQAFTRYVTRHAFDCESASPRSQARRRAQDEVADTLCQDAARTREAFHAALSSLGRRSFYRREERAWLATNP